MNKKTLLLGCVLSLLAIDSTAHADPLKSIAKHLAKGMAKSDNKKIAVLPFSYPDGSMSSGSSIVSERLTNFLAQRSEVQVIERSQLSKILGEMRLEESGITDSSSTQKVGKMLGVGAIVTGSLIDLEDDKAEVNARLIQTESGEVLAADTEKIDRTWHDLPRPPAGQQTASLSAASSSGSQVSDVPASEQDVLTLTNKDLEHTEQMPESPESLVESIMNNKGTTPAHPFAVLRRIYHRNSNRHIRAMALLDIGILLERRGRPGFAANAYRQLLREFPGQPRLGQVASQRLAALGR